MNENKCYWCGKDVSNGIYELDHFLPRSLGGKLKGNIVLACRGCNRSKSNRLWIKTKNGEVLKSRHIARKFAKIVEHEKYYELVISVVSFVRKRSAKGGLYRIPKIDYSNYGEEINYKI